jgi:hypothetical protein
MQIVGGILMTLILLNWLVGGFDQSPKVKLYKIQRGRWVRDYDAERELERRT